MKLSRYILGVVVGFATCVSAFAQTPATPALPKQFGGWQVSGAVHSSSDPAAADPVNAALLKEYGFNDFESATYARDDGRKITVKAARFADTSGAYGAFTYYKLPQMLTEQIGDQGASANERILFYRGHILVDAVFTKLSAMSAAELRELAGVLPPPPGSAANLPTLPAYLPKQSFVKNSTKYVEGPIALDKVGAPVAAAVVDFNAGAEVVLGNYESSGGQATLMLISYPTPQIAADHLHRIDASRQQPDASGAAIYDKRTGPIVVVAAGQISRSEAESLLASVNYEADVTWNENTYVSQKNNLANLLVNVIWLCAILIALMLVAGLAFGGIRIFLRGLFSSKVMHGQGDMEFIALNLAGTEAEAAEETVSPSIKAG